VCVNPRKCTLCPLTDPHSPLYRHLRSHLVGEVALFSGSLCDFLQCGWCMWPQPTATRLQQLLGDMV
jgi:hypothetical protein